MEKRNSHGHTPAGWYSALTIFVGFIVGGFGVGAYSLVVTIIGAAIVVFGILLAVILQKAGFGQFAPEASRSVTSAKDYLGEKRDDDEGGAADDSGSEQAGPDPARAAPAAEGVSGSGAGYLQATEAHPTA